MTTFIKAVLFILVAVLAPLAAVAIVSLWLLMTAPMLFGILFVTGATIYMLKSVVVGFSAFAIVTAGVLLYRAKSKQETLVNVVHTPCDDNTKTSA